MDFMIAAMEVMKRITVVHKREIETVCSGEDVVLKSVKGEVGSNALD